MHSRINKISISKSSPVFIIAELSANHLQNFNVAAKTIRAMKDAGADAVKLQTYTPDTITIDCSNKYFQIKQGTLWDGKSFYELYKGAYTPWDWHPKLKKLAESLGLIFFSSPFDKTAVDFLEKMNVPAYKVASFEITDIPLIEYIASKGKPVIISTGIARLEDINAAIAACRKRGNNDVILLKCTSSYPALPSEMDLNTIPDMITRFNCPVGLSDHSLGTVAAVVAVALGAKVIEKHFILDKKLGGPDAPFSLEPTEFKKLVSDVRAAEQSLGKVTYTLSKRAINNRKFSRSLFVVEDIKKGEIFTEINVRSIRPGDGMPPKDINRVLGRKAVKNIIRGTPLKATFIS